MRGIEDPWREGGQPDMLPPIPEIPQCPDRLSLAGCAPAEPASVSLDGIIFCYQDGRVKVMAISRLVFLHYKEYFHV